MIVAAGGGEPPPARDSCGVECLLVWALELGTVLAARARRHGETLGVGAAGESEGPARG